MRWMHLRCQLGRTPRQEGVEWGAQVQWRHCRGCPGRRHQRTMCHTPARHKTLTADSQSPESMMLLRCAVA